MAINAVDLNSLRVSSDSQSMQTNETSALPKPRNDLSNENESSRGNGSMSIEQTKEVIDSLAGYMEILQTSLGFQVNKETDRVIVQITNKETNEVIRQIPPESLVKLMEKMKELTGIIFSESV